MTRNETLFSRREVDVLVLRAARHDYATIAQRLGITQAEVGTYVGRINRKIRVAQATLLAARDYLAATED